jgi:hypothetical protein
MVKIDSLSVQLVNAETNLPFREHCGPDGNDYVEVEPNAEYWIRIQSDRPGDVLCDFEVDGEHLGFHEILSYPFYTYSDVGIWSKTAGQNLEKSFKVKKLEARDGNEAFWIGSVHVDFYEAVLVAVRDYEEPDFANHWNGGQIPNLCEGSAGKKAVASHVGTTSRVVATDNKSYQPDRWLQSITLLYCTAVGLIHVGVLPKPSAWEYHRMKFPAAITTSYHRAIIQPELLTVQTRTRSGDLLEEKTFEMFNLEDCDDSIIDT